MYRSWGEFLMNKVQGNRDSLEASKPISVMLQCPKCGNVRFEKQQIAYLGKTVEMKGILFEYGSVLSRCSRCRLPVPHQSQYLTYE
jgi:predicted nucleic-acid-binding Zn-ribbon protein